MRWIEEDGTDLSRRLLHTSAATRIPGKAWRENPKIAAFMKAKRASKIHDALAGLLQSAAASDFDQAWKHMIGWDEVLTPGLPKDVIVQSWRGGDSPGARAARLGYTGILSCPVLSWMG